MVVEWLIKWWQHWLLMIIPKIFNDKCTNFLIYSGVRGTTLNAIKSKNLSYEPLAEVKVCNGKWWENATPLAIPHLWETPLYVVNPNWLISVPTYPWISLIKSSENIRQNYHHQY